MYHFALTVDLTDFAAREIFATERTAEFSRAARITRIVRFDRRQVIRVVVILINSRDDARVIFYEAKRVSSC